MDEEQVLGLYKRRIERICKTTERWPRSKLAVSHAETLLLAISLRQLARLLKRLLDQESDLVGMHGFQAGIFMVLAQKASGMVELHRAKSTKAKNERVKGGKASASKRGAVAAKGKVLDDWIAWQVGECLHKNAADFARKMIVKYPEITTPKTVQDWSTAWSREVKAMKKSIGGSPNRLAMMFFVGREKLSLS